MPTPRFESDGALVISDPAAATEFLRHVNYYRLSGFCLAFEASRHQFRQGVTLEAVRHAYYFDRELRDLVTEALEVVELDFRTIVAYHFGQTYGAFGHTDATRFFHRFGHHDWLEKVRAETSRSSELFVAHFRRTYLEFPDLPIWAIAELMSFGTLSRMCNGMLRPDQRAIALRYGIQSRVLVSWMHHLAYVRNLCAHHARLWDRVWSIKPELPRGRNWSLPLVRDNARLFSTLLILNYLMVRCPTVGSYAERWRARVEGLFNEIPAVPNAADLLGLTVEWMSHPLWRKS